MVSLDIQVITASGNNYDIQLKDEDRDMIEYLADEKKSCTRIILHQINNQRIYDRFLKNKNNLAILDIGANTGLFTLYAQDAASKIVSVEPTKNLHPIFEKITEKCNNVELSKTALSNKDGPIEFYVCEENLTMSSLVNKSDKSYIVDGLCIESLLKKYNFDHVDFCKIDIEGSEMIAITEETLKPVFDKIDSFFIEVHSTITSYKHDYEWWDSIIINRVKLQEIFHKVGYKTEVIMPSMYRDAFYAYKE